MDICNESLPDQNAHFDISTLDYRACNNLKRSPLCDDLSKSCIMGRKRKHGRHESNMLAAHACAPKDWACEH